MAEGSGEADGARLQGVRLPLSPQMLAYVGDAVYELYVRLKAATGARPATVRDAHRRVVALVRAEAQTDVLRSIEPRLTDEERDVVRRGRNAATASPSLPPEVRCASTALEALVGYLYLAGRRDRLDELLGPVVEERLTRAESRERGTP